MKRFLFLYFISVEILMVMAFLISNNNKSDFKEYNYSLRCDYSYLYNSNKTMNVYIYSNSDSAIFSDISRNQYYLSDYSEDFMYLLNINYIDKNQYKDVYLYNFNFKIPVSNIEIDDLYFIAVNDKYTYKGSVGSIKITDDLYKSEVGYKSIYGEFNKKTNLLNNIKINLSENVEVNDVLLSNNIKYSYELNNNTLNIKVDNKNYINSMYIIVWTNIGILKIDNFYFGSNDLNFYEYLDLMEVFYYA